MSGRTVTYSGRPSRTCSSPAVAGPHCWNALREDSATSSTPIASAGGVPTRRGPWSPASGSMTRRQSR
ncbi:hypothetical protein, partial [Micrococcus sp. HSID17227]|uniref:hypothetical protein n=1 Tax=Micrococcus sp. HSID17227 TaxID=2419506 RepID=UPI001EE8D283